MKRWRWLGLLALWSAVGLAQSAQFGPYRWNASASGVPSQFPVPYPASVDTLGITVSGIQTAASWTIALQVGPTSSGPWTTCSTVTLAANATVTQTCQPQGSAYLQVTVTAGSGGGYVTGTVFGQNSKIGSLGAGLPTATAAGQAPVSTGAGTTYTAQGVLPLTGGTLSGNLAAIGTIAYYGGLQLNVNRGFNDASIQALNQYTGGFNDALIVSPSFDSNGPLTSFPYIGISTGLNNTNLAQNGMICEAPGTNSVLCSGGSANSSFNAPFTLTLYGASTLATGQVLPNVLYSAAGTPLPTCAAGIQGEMATVKDATSPTYMGAYTSGGAITAAVICSYNGTAYAWLTH